jgi:hypothetical protein
MRIFPPYFESPPVATGTSVAAAAAATGVFADFDDVDGAAFFVSVAAFFVSVAAFCVSVAACCVSVSDDPHATATINKIADTIGSKVLRLSILCLDM